MNTKRRQRLTAQLRDYPFHSMNIKYVGGRISAAGSGSLARLLFFFFFGGGAFPRSCLKKRLCVAREGLCQGGRLWWCRCGAASATGASDLIKFPGGFSPNAIIPGEVHNWSIGILKIFVLPRCFFSESHSQQEDGANPSANQAKCVLYG